MQGVLQQEVGSLVSFISEEGRERRKSKVNPLILDPRNLTHAFEYAVFCV